MTRRVGTSFQVVISAEANPYMAWQAKLAHYSCVSRLGQAPIIVVHHSQAADREDLADIATRGGIVVAAPSYRKTSRGLNYGPRNSAGTLLEAARIVGSTVDYIMLSDPDVVFRRAPTVGPVLSGAACGYLDYTEPPVRAAMKRLGIPAFKLSRPSGGRFCCGIPYIIPQQYATPLALAWLEAIDAFVPPRWEDVMYAFGLAALMLELPLRRLRLADTNYVAEAPARAPVVHYCYDNTLWSKRRFYSVPASRRVWTPPDGAKPGSVLAEVLIQLAEARRFYAGRWAPTVLSRRPDKRTARNLVGVNPQPDR